MHFGKLVVEALRLLRSAQRALHPQLFLLLPIHRQARIGYPGVGQRKSGVFLESILIKLDRGFDIANVVRAAHGISSLQVQIVGLDVFRGPGGAARQLFAGGFKLQRGDDLVVHLVFERQQILRHAGKFLAPQAFSAGYVFKIHNHCQPVL